jgi:hypothetical protein
MFGGAGGGGGGRGAGPGGPGGGGLGTAWGPLACPSALWPQFCDKTTHANT